MALLSQIKRVDLGDGEWVDVKKLSVGEIRRMRSESRNVVPEPGEDKDEAEGKALSDIALQAAIKGWSDPTPINPESVSDLPYDCVPKILDALGLGSDKETPLPTGSPSSDTSQETSEEASPTNG
jgi:hypothetical protein